MLGFNSLANITLSYVFSNLTLHTRPPIKLLEILIHLRASEVNGIQGFMSFLEYQLLKLFLAQYTDTFIKPYGSLLIF